MGRGFHAAGVVGTPAGGALLETVDILSRAEEVRALRDGLDDIAADRTSPLDDVRASMAQRGRLRP